MVHSCKCYCWTIIWFIAVNVIVEQTMQPSVSKTWLKIFAVNYRIALYILMINKHTQWHAQKRVWRYQTGNQNPYIEEEQTTWWPKEKGQKDKQRSTIMHIKLKIE
jgi:hypothetical protein